MALTTHKANYDPHALNIWLTNNHGYTEEHQFIWESVKPLGLTYLGIAKNSELNEALEAG